MTTAQEVKDIIAFCEQATADERITFQDCISGPFRHLAENKAVVQQTRDFIKEACRQLDDVTEVDLCMNMPLGKTDNGETELVATKDYIITIGDCPQCNDKKEYNHYPLALNSREGTICLDDNTLTITLIASEDIAELIVQAHSGTAPEGEADTPGNTYIIRPTPPPLLHKNTEQQFLIPYNEGRDGSLSYLRLYPFKQFGPELRQFNIDGTLITYDQFNVAWECPDDLTLREGNINPDQPDTIIPEITTIVDDYLECNDCAFDTYADAIIENSRLGTKPFAIKYDVIPYMIDHDLYSEAVDLCMHPEKRKDTHCILALAPGLARFDFNRALELCQHAGSVYDVSGNECIGYLGAYMAETQGAQAAFEFCKTTPFGNADNCYLPVYEHADESLAQEICLYIEPHNQESLGC